MVSFFTGSKIGDEDSANNFRPNFSANICFAVFSLTPAIYGLKNLVSKEQAMESGLMQRINKIDTFLFCYGISCPTGPLSLRV